MFKRPYDKGKSYEELIQYVYQQLTYINGQEIEVHRNVQILGKSGVSHQIDVYYEFKQNDILHRVIIECKSYKTKLIKVNYKVLSLLLMILVIA